MVRKWLFCAPTSGGKQKKHTNELFDPMNVKFTINGIRFQKRSCLNGFELTSVLQETGLEN